MEKWREVFVGNIPEAKYQTQITYGEQTGLMLELTSNKNQITIKFGNVLAVRILDEGIVQNEEYSETEIQKYKNEGFKNIIYELFDGNFLSQVKHISDGYLEAFCVKHYVIITCNYNIDIVTEWEPEICII